MISDAKISEVDGILQEFKQSQTVSYSDKMEQANKAELDYLNSSLKILRGREELIRLVNGSEVIQVCPLVLVLIPVSHVLLTSPHLFSANRRIPAKLSSFSLFINTVFWVKVYVCIGDKHREQEV